MSDVLTRWNSLPFDEAADEILACCGSKSWARGMAASRPIHDEVALLAACDEVCKHLQEADWLEAFRSHPRIGEFGGPSSTLPRSAEWSSAEQQAVAAAGEQIKAALMEGNRAYEERFNRVFIVCATGRPALEILEILRRRLRNDDPTELQEAAEQQRQIANLRLKKWLSS